MARAVHETTNASYWAENPDWSTGNPVGDLALRGLRRLPFSVHEMQKNLLFNHSAAVTVSGESIVVMGDDTVKKYMFRYPSVMDPDTFYVNVMNEIEAVTQVMDRSALPTEVSVEEARIFKWPLGAAEAVTQTQEKLNLVENPALTLDDLFVNATLHLSETARDLDILICNAQKLAMDYDLYPDIAFSSSNLRRNIHTGSVTLIDVMPIHADGTRLIGDHPSKLPKTKNAIETIKAFLGNFGA
jgi:hypothetical protein